MNKIEKESHEAIVYRERIVDTRFNIVRFALTYNHKKGSKESTNIKRRRETIRIYTQPNPKRPLKRNPNFSHTKMEREEKKSDNFSSSFVVVSDLNLCKPFLFLCPKFQSSELVK